VRGAIANLSTRRADGPAFPNHLHVAVALRFLEGEAGAL
jgi:hypothetical protein